MKERHKVPAPKNYFFNNFVSDCMRNRTFSFVDNLSDISCDCPYIK